MSALALTLPLDLLASSLVFGQAAGDLAFAVPLVLAISFVYSATRDERASHIISRGSKLTAMLAGFMLLVFAVLAGLSWAA